jgi:membrane protease YdiL (CAAX protease family)
MINQRKRSLQLSLFLVAFFLIWAIRHTSFSAIDESIASPTWRWAYSNLVKLVVWILPAAVFVYVLRGVSPAKYLGLSVWPSRRKWLLCIGVTAAFLLAVTVFETVVRERYFSTASVLSLPVALFLLQLLPGPLLEELFFRGFLLTELLALVPLNRALALSSLLFAGIHTVYWLTQGITTHSLVMNAGACFVFSLLAGWLFAKTSSIWPPTCAHIANNLLSSVLAASNV